MAKIDNYLAVVGKPTADVSEFPSFAEEDFIEAFLPNVASNSQPSSKNIPSEVLSHGVAQEETPTGVSNVQEEPMDIETTWDLDVPSPPHPENSASDIYGLLGDYIAQKEKSTGVSHVEANVNVPPPQPETFSNTLLTAVTPPFSIEVNTDGDPTPVAQKVPPIPTGPSKTQRVSVIMQGPALVDRQPQYGKPMDTGVGNTEGVLPFVIQVTSIPVQISPAPSAPSTSRGKKVAKTNPERCQAYRNRQKIKKEKDEQELRQLDTKNRALKAKETDLRNKIKGIKEAARRMGLGNYFN